MTKVVNLKKEYYDIYIGRGSKWGNPFIMKDESERDEVCDKYEDWFWRSDLILSLPKLKNKTLGCYCKPKRCHGDFLAKLINLPEKELRDLISFNNIEFYPDVFS